MSGKKEIKPIRITYSKDAPRTNNIEAKNNPKAK